MLICINPIWPPTNEKWLYLCDRIMVLSHVKTYTRVFRYKDSFEIPFKIFSYKLIYINPIWPPINEKWLYLNNQFSFLNQENYYPEFFRC